MINSFSFWMKDKICHLSSQRSAHAWNRGSDYWYAKWQGSTLSYMLPLRQWMTIVNLNQVSQSRKQTGCLRQYTVMMPKVINQCPAQKFECREFQLRHVTTEVRETVASIWLPTLLRWDTLGVEWWIDAMSCSIEIGSILHWISGHNSAEIPWLKFCCL